MTDWLVWVAGGGVLAWSAWASLKIEDRVIGAYLRFTRGQPIRVAWLTATPAAACVAGFFLLEWVDDHEPLTASTRAVFAVAFVVVGAILGPVVVAIAPTQVRWDFYEGLKEAGASAGVRAATWLLFFPVAVTSLVLLIVLFFVGFDL